MSVEVYYEGGCYHLVFFGESADELTDLPSILARVDNGERVQLSMEHRRRIDIHKRVASIPIRSIIYHASVAKALATSFLTNRQMDIDLLHSIASDPTTQQRNEVLQEHFQLMIPFADDVPIKQLLKLRQREEEAFFRFQAAMHRMVAEIRSQRGEMADQDALPIRRRDQASVGRTRSKSQGSQA